MITLTSEERRALRAKAHALKPVVAISQNGLSDAVLKEIATSLASHELIKIRVYHDDRVSRDALLQTICDRLDAAPVQHIGKLLVVWKPAEETLAPKKPLRSRADPRRTKRSFQGDR